MKKAAKLALLDMEDICRNARNKAGHRTQVGEAEMPPKVNTLLKIRSPIPDTIAHSVMQGF